MKKRLGWRGGAGWGGGVLNKAFHSTFARFKTRSLGTKVIRDGTTRQRNVRGHGFVRRFGHSQIHKKKKRKGGFADVFMLKGRYVCYKTLYKITGRNVDS